MKNELKVKQSGITLIALIITIIVLLILAGVSISTLTGENGLLNKAGNAKEQMAMAEEKERLELIKATVAIDNNGEVALDKYIEELIKEGITTKEEVTDNEDGSKQIITDKGYSVNVKVDEDGNPTVTVEGKADALPVRIVNVQLTTSTSSIKVDVQVLRGDGATYKYYYKTESTEYKLAHEGKDLSYTIDNLEQNVTYTIKVEAINKNGTVYKEAVGRTEEIQSAVGILEFGSLEWNNGQAEVTITKNTEDVLKIQYQVLDEDLNVVKTYQEIASGEKITGLNLGETVQARLWDGTNGGNSTSITVTDTTAPNLATITLSATEMTTEESITATVTQSDSQSGVDIAKCKWVINTNSSTTIDESLYPSTNTFDTEIEDLITLSQATSGTYYLHILTVDNAGNAVETVSSAITVIQKVTGVSVSPTTATIEVGATQKITATVTPSTANNTGITWSSSNTSVATVSGGTVTGVAPGAATITATAADGSGKKATCTVTVEGEVASKTTSYVGYYADIDGDKEPDGVIYADLAFTVSGDWGDDSWCSFSYYARTGTKDYYVSKTNYEGDFGTKDVLTATGSGAARFYVMALTDINPGTKYCWYDAAYDNAINDYATVTSGEFGTGKTNTETMITKWNNKKYGAQNSGSYADMWGAIQDEVDDGWFVPSVSEWDAFGYNLGITKSNYGDYGLSDEYWSSSLYNAYYTWSANFCDGCTKVCYSLSLPYTVRLSATF